MGTTLTSKRDIIDEQIQKNSLKPGDVFVLKTNTNAGQPSYRVFVCLEIKDKGKEGKELTCAPAWQRSGIKGKPPAPSVLTTAYMESLNGAYIQKIKPGDAVYISTKGNPESQPFVIKKINNSWSGVYMFKTSAPPKNSSPHLRPESGVYVYGYNLDITVSAPGQKKEVIMHGSDVRSLEVRHPAPAAASKKTEFY